MFEDDDKDRDIAVLIAAVLVVVVAVVSWWALSRPAPGADSATGVVAEASADGGVVVAGIGESITLTGTVADEARRASLVASFEKAFKPRKIIDRLTIGKTLTAGAFPKLTLKGSLPSADFANLAAVRNALGGGGVPAASLGGIDGSGLQFAGGAAAAKDGGKVTAAVTDGDVTLTGTVANEAARVKLVKAMEKAFAPRKVIDKLTLSSGLDGATAPTLRFTGSLPKAGFADAAAVSAALTAAGLAPGDLANADLSGLQFAAAVPTTATAPTTVATATTTNVATPLKIALTEATIILEGAVPDQATADALVAAAAAEVGTANVTNKLTVVAGTPLPLKVTIAGQARSDADKARILARFKAISGLQVTDTVTLRQRTQLEIDLNQLVTLAPVQFDSGSSSIRPESLPTLDQAAAILARNPTAAVNVEGHTDSDGDPAANQVLSEQRAAAVMQYLVSKGVGAAQLRPAGFGSTRPVADNGTDQGRQANRRIEFVARS